MTESDNATLVAPKLVADKRLHDPVRQHYLSALILDPDPLYRPVPELIASVGMHEDKGLPPLLDRPTVPICNALFARGIKTCNSCCAHESDRCAPGDWMIGVRGITRRGEAALRMLGIALGESRCQLEFSVNMDTNDTRGGDIGASILLRANMTQQDMDNLTDAEWLADMDARSLNFAQHLADRELPEADTLPLARWLEMLGRWIVAQDTTASFPDSESGRGVFALGVPRTLLYVDLIERVTRREKGTNFKLELDIRQLEEGSARVPALLNSWHTSVRANTLRELMRKTHQHFGV